MSSDVKKHCSPRPRRRERTTARHAIPPVNSALLKRNPSVAETAFRVTGSGRGGGGDLNAAIHPSRIQHPNRPHPSAGDDTHGDGAPRPARLNAKRRVFASVIQSIDVITNVVFSVTFQREIKTGRTTVRCDRLDAERPRMVRTFTI